MIRFYRSRKGDPPLEPKTVLIRAIVHDDRDGALFVKLIDGFGQAECVVHKDAIVVEEKQSS